MQFFPPLKMFTLIEAVFQGEGVRLKASKILYFRLSDCQHCSAVSPLVSLNAHRHGDRLFSL